MAYDEEKSAVYAALDLMIFAEKDWENFPGPILGLDEECLEWIAAALASEGIGKVS